VDVGFAEGITVELAVTAEDPHPKTVLRLIALATEGLDPLRTIVAVFSVEGRVVGTAARVVQVVADRRDLPTGSPATAVDSALPASMQETDCQDPYRSGMSRHGVPARVRHRIPSINCRLVHVRGRPRPLTAGSRGASSCHCASVRS
jgi:hypothetical protein